MANQYDTNLKLQAIADAIGDSQSSGLIQALEDIADAVAGGGGGGSSTAGLVSDNFSETDTYDLDDYCIHNNTLYVCINAITTPGPWDLSDWQATNAGVQLSSLNSALTKYTLLWTNSNPTADFASQRILEGVDISQYDFIQISTSNGDCICQPGYIAYVNIYGTGGGVYYAFSRYFDCRVPTNGISVSDTNRIKIQDGTYGVANGNNIPINVYGVKIPT